MRLGTGRFVAIVTLLYHRPRRPLQVLAEVQSTYDQASLSLNASLTFELILTQLQLPAHLCISSGARIGGIQTLVLQL